MGLNRSKGNMYSWLSHTWNPLAGECPHHCSYCSTNKLMRYPGIKNKYTGKPRLHELEFKTNLGKGNFIFVAAQNDLFAENIPDKMIQRILDYCNEFDNKYLFQTKNPQNVLRFIEHPAIKDKSVICTTLETNRIYPEIMGNTPPPHQRATDLGTIAHYGIKTYVTIEPIMDFDLNRFVFWLKGSEPTQVNIGVDTGGNKLPEPSKEKLLQLIEELQKFTIVHNKKNLKRLL